MPRPPKKTEKTNELQSPKGMRDLIGDEWLTFQGFFEKAAEIALYYGFKPIEVTMLEKEELFARGLGSATDIVEKEMYTLKTRGGDRLALRPEFTAGIMRAYIEHGMQSWPQPVNLYAHGPVFRHENPQAGRFREHYQFGLESLGTGKSIADALIIKIQTAILEEVGLAGLVVRVNSIGDEECRPSYRKDLVAYYKKHARQICADCRERLKTNPLRVLDCKHPDCQPIKAGAPDSVSYLCGPCKQHFKEVLEYLENLEIPYEIDPTLVRGLDYYTRTVWEITAAVPSGEEGKTTALAVAGGGRYDALAKALGYKKPLPAVGCGIGVDRVVSLPGYARPVPRIVKKPKVFFVQLSPDAKLKSIGVIEILRRAHIPVQQSLAKDSLGVQLGIAERLQVPYTIILGQKEAFENTVIVRNMDTHSQETVAIADLAEYMKQQK